MDKDLINRLLWISVTALFLAEIIFIGLYLFSTERNDTLLYAALFCNVLAVLYNIARGFNKKEP